MRVRDRSRRGRKPRRGGAPAAADPLCSFCGKSRSQAQALVAGPGIYICDECVDLSTEIVDRKLGPSGREAGVEAVVDRVEEVLRAARLVLDGRDDAAREHLTRLLESWDVARPGGDRRD